MYAWEHWCTEGADGGESPRAALLKRRHFQKKCENLRKKGKMYVKKGTILSKNGQKS